MGSMKKIVLVLMIAAVMAFLAAPAHATCQTLGKIVVLNLTGTSAVVYLSTGGVVSFYRFYSTNNLQFITMLTAAQASGSWVRITGNASTCSGTGLTRNGGTITDISAF
jgi:hypothetical protein